MKYEIELNQHIHKRIEVFAETPAAALKLAGDSNPGFTAEVATELLDKDEIGKTYEVAAQCEGCERIIFDGELYNTTDDGIDLCTDCAMRAQ